MESVEHGLLDEVSLRSTYSNCFDCIVAIHALPIDHVYPGDRTVIGGSNNCPVTPI